MPLGRPRRCRAHNRPSRGRRARRPLMLALFSLGQHAAPQAVQAQLQDGDRFFAFLDDVCVVCAPSRVNAICGILQHALFAHVSIRVHYGKTQVWGRGSVVPLGIEVLQAVARVNDPDATVWRGDPTLRGEYQGVRILGTPLGHPDFVRSQLSALSETHDQLLEKVLTIQDLQCAWLRLLYCCGARANYTLSVVHPELTMSFAARHDASLRRCLSQLLGVAPANMCWDLARLPLSLGGLGLRSATLLSRPAFWASWADCLEMIHQRHPTVCARVVDALHTQHPSVHLAGVRASGEHFPATGFRAPSWQELAAGVRLGRRHGTWHSPPQWVAAQSHGTSPWLSRRRHRQTQTFSVRTGAVQIARWSVGWCPVHVLPCVPSVQDGFFPLPRAAPWAPLASSHLPRASAGVAVHLTPVATTEQFAPRHGCRVVEGTLLKAPPLTCLRTVCCGRSSCPRV